MLKYLCLLLIFFCSTAFAEVSKSAVLAWKFPVMNGIVCDEDNIVKWNVVAHPQMPTDGEISTWKQEYALQVTAKEKEETELNALGKMLKSLSPASQAELISALKAKAQQEGK